MKLRTWLVIVYSCFGLYFLIGTFGAEDDLLPPSAMAVAAVYCGVWVLILLRTTGRHAQLMLITAVTIAMTYMARAVILTLDSDRLLKTPGEVIVGADVRKALWYTLVATVLFCLGVRLGLAKANVGAPHVAGKDAVLLANRRAIIGLSLIGAVVATTLSVTGSARSTDTGSSEFLFLSRLIPVHASAFILMALLTFRTKACSLGDRVAIALFFVLYVAADFVAGRRGSLLAPGLVWLVTEIWNDREGGTLRPRHAAIGAALSITVLPLLFNAVLQIRDVVSTGGTAFQAVSQERQRPSLNAVDVGEVLSDRLASFDATIAVVHEKAPALEAELTVANTIRSTIQDLVPDSVWQSQQAPLGALFARHYERLPSTVSHHGAWSGFGLTYAFAGWFGTVIAFSYGALVGTVVRWFDRSSLMAGGLSTYAVSVLTFTILTSGNIDTIASELLLQILVGGGLILMLKGMTLARRPSSGLEGNSARSICA